MTITEFLIQAQLQLGTFSEQIKHKIQHGEDADELIRDFTDLRMFISAINSPFTDWDEREMLKRAEAVARRFDFPSATYHQNSWLERFKDLPSVKQSGLGELDHGTLKPFSLLDDDHPQYFNQARGDARYVLRSGAQQIVKMNLRYTEGAEKPVMEFPADAVIWEIKVNVKTSFNSVSNTFSVGTSLGGELFSDNLNNLLELAGFKNPGYGSSLPYLFPANDILWIKQTPGGAITQGECDVYVFYSII